MLNHMYRLVDGCRDGNTAVVDEDVGCFEIT